jgi:hypothetical protein
MKIRNGFVSNSSSSSFLLVTTKTNYDKVLEELSLSEEEQELLKDCDDLFGTKKVFGQDLITISYVEGNYSDFEDLPEGAYELIEEQIVTALRKDSDNCFTHHMDF